MTSTGEASTPTSRRVIFLDIDGVVAPVRSRLEYSDLEPACMDVLNRIVTESGAEVVVSSSWRYGKSVADLQILLVGGGFAGRVIDKTTTELRGSTRGEEIAHWLDGNPVDSYVILDDHADVGNLLDHLVRTNAGHGLQAHHVDAALALLNSRQ